ncbi:ABC transporter ATP-binding protein [Noviherbaspirillum sp. UKPF54]|uniref:ABC transporter ATP-binding protein n=1 Tax=Noviherbaspirillum sp. UKPF54 TaxID=2601898 RepID=UPI0011B1A550|nr:ABC transporter ATP-binding protein [Noviherbaspirillum sp. UKPF54]QDZ28428.1 ABC transporter ATP-binding protein [Noviherbaspirillum sp. UKPF54]
MMQAAGLSLRVRGRLLVDALDWQVRPGECWCVIGRNGAGKSTLLRTLAGLREPDGGRVCVGGRDLAAWPLLELARQRAYLPQNRNDAFGYRVIETVLAARHPYQDAHYWDAEQDHQRAHAALRALDVDALAQRDIRTLSGGERQRVAIAAALAQDTPLLLLDEPANALDLAHQVGVMELMASLCRRDNKSIVMVSHDLNLAHSAATHALLLMGDGRWIAADAANAMKPSLLSACLGYPIETVQHGGRTIFIPTQRSHHE